METLLQAWEMAPKSKITPIMYSARLLLLLQDVKQDQLPFLQAFLVLLDLEFLFDTLLFLDHSRNCN
jgi:hypothetical protein